jgi:flagellar hook-basal body protein
MDRLVYLSMSGAKASLQRQEVLANNLANASTPGFRAEMAAFRAVPVQGDGASTRAFALETTIGHDERPGAVQTTGRDLDVAPAGRTWLAVQGLDGTEAYTRAGALQVDAEGQLVTRDRPARAGRRRHHHHPCRGAGLHRPRRHRQHRGRQRPAAAGGAAQAGAARRQARARRRRPVPRRRRQRASGQTRKAGCRAAHWKAPTSTRSRPWWP